MEWPRGGRAQVFKTEQPKSSSGRSGTPGGALLLLLVLLGTVFFSSFSLAYPI